MDPQALSDELEAALFAALQEEPGEPAEPVTPPSRSDWLVRAEALAAEAPVGSALVIRQAAKPPAVLNSEYVSMIKSYGPFPALLPPGRDFRPLLALSVLGGLLGLDRFYLGKPVSGVLKLVTAGGAGIWWIADIIAVLTGRTTDKAGHRFSGDRKQLAIAWALTAALFTGLIPATVAPAVSTAVGAAREAIFPTPAPVPTWAPLAEGLQQAQGPVTLNITGERIRFTYNFPAGAYVYIQKVGDTMVPATTVLLKDKPSEGVTELPMAPGSYQLFVRAEGNGWTGKVEELRLNG